MRLFISLNSAWMGSFDVNVTDSVGKEIRRAMKDLCSEFPSLSHIHIKPLENNLDWIMATKSKTSLYINEKLFVDDHLSKYAKEWDGMLVEPTAYGIVVHECGHILDGQLLDKMGARKYNKWLDRWIEDRTGIWNTHTTAYGQENSFEFMAETFSVHFLRHTANGVHRDFQTSHQQVADEIWTEARQILRR